MTVAAAHALTLKSLIGVREEGLMPAGRIVYLGLGFLPPKVNAIAIDPHRMPAKDDLAGIAGLDVILTYYGNKAKYGEIRTLCDRITECRPRRLQLMDIDNKRVAYLKVANA